jgi:alkylation response protein AidB-like acyl-CoA dehydrogenase
VNFDLSPEQKALQETVASMLAAHSSVQRTLGAYEEAQPLDEQLWRRLMDLGLGGIAIPEEHGGAGLKLLDVAVVVEVLGRFAAPAPLIEHALAAYAIMLAGDEKQKVRWLAGLASGELRATIALLEEGEAWIHDSWSMPASSKLSGTKLCVPFVEGADIIVVGLKGKRFAVVEARAPGLSIERVQSFDPSHRLATVTFDQTPATLLGGPDADAGARFCDAALVLLAADAFGGGSRCVADATAYAKDREQFGRPIGSFQAVKHQLADMALEIEPALGLYWYAAYVFDAEPGEAPLAAALAKAHVTETYAQIARRMVELHGGIGYTWEHGAHIWLKRSVYNRTVFGTPAFHLKRAATLAGW